MTKDRLDRFATVRLTGNHPQKYGTMDRPRPTALDYLIKAAHDAAARHQNPVTRLSTALMDAATSPADPHLVIANLLQGIVHIIVARIPLDRQREVAAETETRLSKLLTAWGLK